MRYGFLSVLAVQRPWPEATLYRQTEKHQDLAGTLFEAPCYSVKDQKAIKSDSQESVWLSLAYYQNEKPPLLFLLVVKRLPTYRIRLQVFFNKLSGNVDPGFNGADWNC